MEGHVGSAGGGWVVPGVMGGGGWCGPLYPTVVHLRVPYGYTQWALQWGYSGLYSGATVGFTVGFGLSLKIDRFFMIF